ncbi:hypothetical protein E2C01_008965 [Portunus trituberculatus]|uniref:Uncharacterized protein n=1 Tax=Portunus trituberculatus TaxID=210409 RepID=A0A5B7D486_PORTR|nr:hypothetical protein [Portunus trituberculatus]
MSPSIEGINSNNSSSRSRKADAVRKSIHLQQSTLDSLLTLEIKKKKKSLLQQLIKVPRQLFVVILVFLVSRGAKLKGQIV